jgi:hypothetical protein
MPSDVSTASMAWTLVGEVDGCTAPECFGGQWMSSDDQQALKHWIDRLKLLLPLYTCLWSAVHLGSIAFASLTWSPKSSLRPKDKFIWHNKCDLYLSMSDLLEEHGL